MAVEPKRNCGYRKVGGMYLVGGGPGVDCHRLPLNIHVCPVCSTGLKHTMGFTWIDPSRFFGMCPELTDGVDHSCHKFSCAVCNPPGGKHGLLWIGKKFYTPGEFVKEATQLGISKRISAIPNDFVLGETWIYLAHVGAGRSGIAMNESDFVFPEDEAENQVNAFPEEKPVPAVFYVFKPQRIEKIITESQSKDTAEMELLQKRGITPVIVPDNDKDHQGSVHDKDE